jgi:hypothetical protein
MDITQTIRECIEKKLNVEINYRNSDKELYKSRIVSPHFYYELEKGNPILIAKYVSGLTEAEEMKPVRSYKIRNIMDAQATKFKFEVDETLRPKDKNLVTIATVF